MADLKQWCDDNVAKTMKDSLLGKAIRYTINQWDTLVRYLEDGNLQIDNNAAERHIKPFVIGRKNWLFNQTPRGADASALLYSLVQTAVANNLEPFARSITTLSIDVGTYNPGPVCCCCVIQATIKKKLSAKNQVGH